VTEMASGKRSEVIILDDDEDLRQSVVATVELFTKRHCAGVGSFKELVGARGVVMHSKLAILDINLGPDRPSGIDAYRWLRKEGYTGVVVFLTGHGRSDPQVAAARELGDTRIFQKPFAVEAFVQLVDESTRDEDA
jgi:FixJ family two-component response regulator